MIDERYFKNAQIIDPFDDLTDEEKLESRLLADVAIAINKKRHALNMTQKEFADHMGVSQTLISKWESGEYNFSLNKLDEICTTLGLKISIDSESPKRSKFSSAHVNRPAKTTSTIFSNTSKGFSLCGFSKKQMFVPVEV